MTPNMPSSGRVDVLRRIDGLFVGMLDADELETFNDACRSGEAMRSFDGGAGLMGVAKVRVLASSITEPQS